MKRHQYGGRTANASHVPQAITSIKMENALHLLRYVKVAKFSQYKIIASVQQDNSGMQDKINAKIDRLSVSVLIQNIIQIP